MLYHFSEDPSIRHFEPRPHRLHPDKPPLVWAIDETRAPLYFFPRDCPRIAYYAKSTTTAEDRERLLAHTTARIVIAIENRWLQQMQSTPLYCYHLPTDTFTLLDSGAGYYVSPSPVTPVRIEPMGDLLQRLASADVELRLTPSLLPLRETLPHTTLHFSMIRLK